VAGSGTTPGRRLAAFFMVGDMTIQRIDNVAIVVDDLNAAVAFFTELGMELEGKGQIEGLWADRTVGLDGVRSDIAMMRTPDGHSKLELSKYHTPAAAGADRRTRRPTRWACIASCSPSTTSTTPSQACAPTAPNCPAMWRSTKASSSSAFSAAPQASSSLWPNRSADAILPRGAGASFGCLCVFVLVAGLVVCVSVATMDGLT
jgi:hypothetical protein